MRIQGFLWTPEWMTVDLKDTWNRMPSKRPLCQGSSVPPSLLPLLGHLCVCFLVDKMENMATNSSRLRIPLSGHLKRASTDSIPNSWWGIRVRLLATVENSGWSHGLPVTLGPRDWRDAHGHLHTSGEPSRPSTRRRSHPRMCCVHSCFSYSSFLPSMQIKKYNFCGDSGTLSPPEPRSRTPGLLRIPVDAPYGEDTAECAC